MNAPSMQVSTTDEARQMVVAPQATGLLEAISRAASDPAMDMDKVERLFKMHEALEARQAETAFNAAMARAQARMEPVLKNKRNEQTNSNYANLAAINEAIKPIYTAEGFSITFDQGDSPKPDYLRLNAYVMHERGHTKQLHLDMPPDESGIKGTVNKTKVHATGSTNMYARRYLTCMAFNIDTVDDTDSNARRREIGKNVDPQRRREIQENVITEVKKHIADGAINDAVLALENGGLDGPDEWTFAWTFFDSKERSAMKKANERMREERKKKPITEADRKRLEKKITGLGLDRDAVKAHCQQQFGKEHFADLNAEQYSALDEALESMVPAQVIKSGSVSPVAATPAAEATPTDAPQDSTAGLPAAPSHEDAGQGLPADASTPTDVEIVADIEGWVKRKRFDMAYDLCRGIKDEAFRGATKKRIDTAKGYVDFKQSDGSTT